jgi:hypothetical protein
MPPAGEIDFFGVGQALAAVRLERIFCCNHNTTESREGIPWRVSPFASITWIRFNGSFAWAKLSACRLPARRQRNAQGKGPSRLVTAKGEETTGRRKPRNGKGEKRRNGGKETTKYAEDTKREKSGEENRLGDERRVAGWFDWVRLGATANGVEPRNMRKTRKGEKETGRKKKGRELSGRLGEV